MAIPLERQGERDSPSYSHPIILPLSSDAKNMARDVQQCLIKMIAKKESKSEEEAQTAFKTFEKSRRYLADVW